MKLKGKRWKKAAVASVSFVLCLSFASCAPSSSADNGSNGGNGDTKVEFWSTYATEKVLQDLEFTGEKFAPKLEVFAAHGEYESGQILMTAETDVRSYDVKITDLKTSGGDVFPKENIILYNQKYIDVNTNYEQNGAPLGMYPDAILPFAAAKNFGENKIEAGENQGLYFTFNVPESDEEVVSGVYTGTFTITYDGKIQEIPVRLTVEDLTVPNEVHAKNIFLSQWNYQSGELNGSQEMLDAYTDKLIEYRLAPQYVVNDSMHTDEDIAYYTEKAYEYMQNERLSNISIPYGTYYAPNGELSIDKTIFEKYLRSFAIKSFETGYNMFDKSNVYFNIIDEPDSQGLLERTKQVYADYKETINKVADELQEDTSFRAENKDEVIAGIRNLPEVIPCYYSTDYAPYVDTLVPGVHGFLEDYEALKAHQEELWWYTCIGPRAPQPTYHTEDTLVSAREMSWMQAEYDVVGNLYWAVNRYAMGANNAELEDYYANACRYPLVNGDGYLFYPGGQYELDEPVGSLRLEAIRDGLEEYEIALQCEAKYEELSEKLGIELDWKGAFNKITKTIYNETIVTSGSAEFYAARRNFYDLAKLTLNGSDFAMIEFSENEYGDKLSYSFYLKSGYTFTVNGEEIAPAGVLPGGNRYNVEINRNDSRQVVFGVKGEGTDLTFIDELGGKVTQYSADEFEGSFMSGTATVETVLHDNTVTGSIAPGLRGMFLQLKVGAVQEGEDQNIRFSNAFTDSLNETVDKVVMYLYYTGEEELDFSVAVKYSEGDALIRVLATVTLQPNSLNKVELPNIYSINWEANKSVDYMLFYYEGRKISEDVYEKHSAADDNVYLFDTIVYGR